MMYVNCNYCTFGLCPSHVIIKKLENTMFYKLNFFQSSGEGERQLLDPIYETLCSLDFFFGQSPKPSNSEYLFHSFKFTSTERAQDIH
jgi:hypothetical protein